MTHLGPSHEYGLHCLLRLAGSRAEPLSSRDLAGQQGASPSSLAKVLTRLEKAGIVRASEDKRGGFRLARDPGEITVLDVFEAIGGRQPLFECRQVRRRCAVFGGAPPAWWTGGTCAIHAVMRRAERSMRDELARETIGNLARAGTIRPGRPA
jgi:Rrf2 family protein